VEDTNVARLEDYAPQLALRYRDRAIGNVQTHYGTTICCQSSLFEPVHNFARHLMSQVLGDAG